MTMRASSRYSVLKGKLENLAGELKLQIDAARFAIQIDPERPAEQTEESVDGVQRDIEITLFEAKVATLDRVYGALRRLEQGNYGNCPNCGDEIAEKRLMALPFAVRCKDCEEQREEAAAAEITRRRRVAAGLEVG